MGLIADRELCSERLGLEEVADLIEQSEIIDRRGMSGFDVLRLRHPSLGLGILVTSHGNDHLFVRAA